jgi:hypothetical protein
MALAELAGGLGGAMGGYSRSRRRMAKRRDSVTVEAAPMSGVQLQHVDLATGLPSPPERDDGAHRW